MFAVDGRLADHAVPGVALAVGAGAEGEEVLSRARLDGAAGVVATSAVHALHRGCAELWFSFVVLCDDFFAYQTLDAIWVEGSAVDERRKLVDATEDSVDDHLDAGGASDAVIDTALTADGSIGTDGAASHLHGAWCLWWDVVAKKRVAWKREISWAQKRAGGMITRLATSILAPHVNCEASQRQIHQWIGMRLMVWQ